MTEPQETPTGTPATPHQPPLPPDAFERALDDLAADVRRQADARATSLEDVLDRGGLGRLVRTAPPPPEDVDGQDDGRDDGWGLVRAAQDGDSAAFGQLFDRYHDIVFRFVFFRLGDRPAAEDLAQETFVRAFRRIMSVSYQGRDIGAWFVTIARDLVLDHVKSSRYRLEGSTPEGAEVADATDATGVTDVIDVTDADLVRLVAHLGEDQQECLTLRFLQGLSVAETAEIMGRNEGAVKALQHRAVRRLSQLAAQERQDRPG